ncbi:autotransporter outer membrane beta-barrel domain-containing protein [Phenylobacterium sp.]|jgi:outer membrane autotransporter protein|uniref:autotransporter outer membrane beta-barrel domain-containing protein n=1 Tax=Phenylobacterium sp. TaxID=1871053 RepID=UPI002F95D128
MKRLFLSAAVIPLLTAAAAQAETKISTATTSPVATATLANGQPDDLTVEAQGSIKPTSAGVAVTLNSNNKVTNAGQIGFTGVNDATGVLVLGGFTGSVANSGTISLLEDFTPADSDNDGDLDGPFAQGSNRFGLRLTGTSPFVGNITNSGTINVEGNDSGAIRLDGRLQGSLLSSGSAAVTGDRSTAISAASVSGDVRITGAVSAQGEGSVGVTLGDVDGAVVLQSLIAATGYRSATRAADAARAKLDADDLKQGGPAVRISGNVAKGVLLDRPPADNSTTDTDEDDDGVADAAEGTATLTAYGAAPALDIGGTSAIALGAVGTGDLAVGLVNRGTIAADGVNDAIAATALRIGQASGAGVTVQGGVNSSGTIRSLAYGATSTAVLVNPGASVAAFRNSGDLQASEQGGKHDARALVDLSGSLALVENQGNIAAVVTPKTGETATGKAVAIDLSANTTGATVRQSKLTATSAPAIKGEVRFGSGADRLELLGGTLAGDLSFGSGADAFVIDGGATATTRLSDADGLLALDLRDGRLALSNTGAVQLSSLSLGAKGVLAVTIDDAAGTATRLNVSGATTVASGAQLDLTLASLVKTAKSYEIVRAGSLQAGSATANLVGAPFLYTATLRADAAQNALVVDVKPKTAAELGLNRSGAQAYSAVFAALDKDDGVEATFLAQKTQTGFQAAFDQMLPDHSGGALMSAQAISSAISSAVAEAPSHDDGGGNGIWAQQIIFHIDRDRDQAQGFKSQAYGLAAGAEMVGDAQALGVNLSFVTDTYKDQGAAADERVVMNFLGGGAYWRVHAGGLRAGARAGVAYVKFDSDRRFGSTQANLAAKADWTGWAAEAHAGVRYEAQLGWLVVRPELSLDYLRLNEEGYRESGGGAGFDLTVGDRESDLLTGQALLAIGARFGEESWVAPELKVGWRAKLAGDAGRTTARFGSGDPFTLDPEEPFDGGLVARVGVRGGAPRVLWSVDAGGSFDEGYSEYDFRALIRYLF